MTNNNGPQGIRKIKYSARSKASTKLGVKADTLYRSGVCISPWYHDDEIELYYTNMTLFALMPAYEYEQHTLDLWLSEITSIFPRFKGMTFPSLVADGLHFELDHASVIEVHMYAHFMRMPWEIGGFLTTYAVLRSMAAPIPLAIYIAERYYSTGGKFTRTSCMAHTALPSWRECLLDTYINWGKQDPEEELASQMRKKVRNVLTDKRKYGEPTGTYLASDSPRFKGVPGYLGMANLIQPDDIRKIVQWQK